LSNYRYAVRTLLSVLSAASSTAALGFLAQTIKEYGAVQSAITLFEKAIAGS
jgi:hypothetical protein